MADDPASKADDPVDFKAQRVEIRSEKYWRRMINEDITQ